LSCLNCRERVRIIVLIEIKSQQGKLNISIDNQQRKFDYLEVLLLYIILNNLFWLIQENVHGFQISIICIVEWLIELKYIKGWKMNHLFSFNINQYQSTVIIKEKIEFNKWSIMPWRQTVHLNTALTNLLSLSFSILHSFICIWTDVEAWLARFLYSFFFDIQCIGTAYITLSIYYNNNDLYCPLLILPLVDSIIEKLLMCMHVCICVYIAALKVFAVYRLPFIFKCQME